MKKKSIFIELTNNCNLSCNYCNKYHGNDYIDLMMFEKIIDQIINNYIDDIRLLGLWGGEPLLHPNFDKILQILEKYFIKVNKGLTLIINTNGILLGKKNNILNNFFKKFPHINFIIYISLDGLGSKGNTNRGITEKQFHSIINIIKRVNKNIVLANFKIEISSVLSLKNSSLKELIEFVYYFKNLGINIIFCFQEIVLGINIKILKLDIKLLLTKYLFLIKKGYNVVIESNEDVNNFLRIDYKGVVYNFIDNSFKGSEKFIVGNKGNLDFIKNNKPNFIENEEIWSILYVYKIYIKLIKLLFKIKNKRLNKTSKYYNPHI